MICTTNVDVNLFLEKASCIKLVFYNLWVTERAAVPVKGRGRVRVRLCSSLTTELWLSKQPHIYVLCLTHLRTSYFTFSSFDSMYPLRSESYFRQAWSRKVTVNGHPEIITCATLYNKDIFKSIQETLKDGFAPGCLLTRCKYRICQRWIPKCLQHSLMLSSRKLCSIYNVWRSENSFTTESSLNMVPSLGPEFASRVYIFTQRRADAWCHTVPSLIIPTLCNRRRRAVTDGLPDR